MLKKEISFAILSGGKSSRMGIDKAFLEIEGVPLIQRILQLANSFPEIMIITNTPELYTKFDCQIYTDIFPNRGPISGIHSALFHATFKNIFVISCDMPFVTMNTISYLISHHTDADITVPSFNGKTFFVCAVYSRLIFDKLDDYLKKGLNLPFGKQPYFALYNLERMFRTQIIPFAVSQDFEKEFKNINSIEDWLELSQKR